MLMIAVGGIIKLVKVLMLDFEIADFTIEIF